MQTMSLSRVTEPLLYSAGRVYSPADPDATALAVVDGRVTWVGALSDAPGGMRRVDMGDCLITPAFVDSHVHLTDTGLALSGLDLGNCRSAVEVLDRLAGHATGTGGVVIGHGWDLEVPPSAAQLDAVLGGRPVYLARVDGHSAVCSSVLLARGRGLRGYDAGGWVRVEAHHAVREAAYASVGVADRLAAGRRALRRAAAVGIAAVHECGGPVISSEGDFTGVLSLGDGFPRVFGFWGELCAAGKARELGAVGAGGDLCVDGALGSRTACVRSGYVDDGSLPASYLTVEQVAAHVVDCAAHGVQGGFHAIGDGAVAVVMAGFAVAAERVGVEVVRAGRYRVEHAELLDKELIASFVEFGVVASVQPAFDRLWGGEGGMYAARLGAERALAANPLGTLRGVGVTLAFGSDAPVTPLDPWGGVWAAVGHHNPVQRMSARAAFAAHTRGGWRAVRCDEGGVLVPGAEATFAVWDTAARDVAEVEGSPRCVRTVLGGVSIFAGS